MWGWGGGQEEEDLNRAVREAVMRSHSGPETSEQSRVGWRRLWGLEKEAQGAKGRRVAGGMVRSRPVQSPACCVTLGPSLSFLGPIFLI